MRIETYNLEHWQKKLEEGSCSLQKNNFIDRLWKKDHTLWKEEDREISCRLGWLDSPRRMEPMVEFYRQKAEEIRSSGTNFLALLGMGGSSLAPEAISRLLRSRPGWPQLMMLDSTSPLAVNSLASQVTRPGIKPLFLVSSKSGTTAETLSFLNYFYAREKERAGSETGKSFSAITDPGTPLERLASELGFGLTIHGFPDVGGRFSALSPFGLFPAALIGFDLRTFLKPAIESYELLLSGRYDHPGLKLGTFLGVLAENGLNKLTFILPAGLFSLGRWLEQLIAESIGKEGKGILPVLENFPVSLESYTQDRVFVVYEVEGTTDIFWKGKIEELKKSGFPLIRISFVPEQLSAHFYLWELATAVAGHFLQVNPFDQPDVELTKKKTRELLASGKIKTADLTEKTSEGEEVGLEARLRDFFVKKEKTPAYLAILCFLPPGESLDVALSNLARLVSEKYHLPCVWNYGPAYLHSTGQLYKGDSGEGLFLGLVDSGSFDLPIPDLPGCPAPARSFRQLFLAQARADFAALKEKGRRVLALEIGENLAEKIFVLSEIIRNL
ncbi:MAG: hypothetical protein QME28_05445 [Candidatus Saccharicenans sp.]|nr:hypothetical protein [Candidatus Saccharicenans sp.]